MVIKEIREILPEDALVFDNPSYDNSIVGVTVSDRVVYSYDKMIKELALEDGISEEDAM